MKTVRLGLIGCGKISPLHVEGYQMADNARITALCAPRLQKAYDLADKCGLADVKFFADYRDMLAQDGIVDAVDIITPDHLHPPIAKDCAAAGLHILCEKPLALNAADARQVYDAAEKARVLNMVGLVYRFYPAMLTAKQLIDEGRIGDMFHFRGRLTVSRLSNPELPLEWRQDRERGGYGALSDLGAHLVDLARFLTKDEFTQVTGLGQIFVRNRLRPDDGKPVEVTAYDAAAFSGKMTRGTLVQMEVSRFSAGESMFEIDGSGGSIRYMDGKLYMWKKEIVNHQIPASRFDLIDIDPEKFDVHERNLYAGFVHSVATNTPMHPDFSDGVICQEVLDAVDESIRAGEVITIKAGNS